jgi:Protein kinase domain
MSLEAGQEFAGYTILRVLGAGGMGRVYLALHPRLAREDALKVLPPDLTGNPEFRGRFEREAELAAGLSHPHIVGIHDRGEFDGQFWISMDYVAGTDAAQLLRENYPAGMPVEEALPIITAVASALDYAHHRGLLHRDVKPANILLAGPDGQERRAFLADFGIARRIDDSAGLTSTKTAVGTVNYAAPEQLKGEAIDGRADQYALACTAFHLLAGTPPYSYSNPAVVITHHVSAPPPSLGACRPELAALDPVFCTALAKDPSSRFGSCQEFAGHLGRQLSGAELYTQPPPAATHRKRWRPRVLIGALVAIALLIAGGVFASMNIAQPHTPTGTPGPFTGTYRTDFGAIIGLDDAPDPSATPALTGTYGVRSVCRATGCVATGTRLGGAPVPPATVVFDQIGTVWVAVVVASDRCQDAPAEFWEVFTLQPRPDGALVGEYVETGGSTCADKRTVTFTRTGDVDANSVPDPAALPARVVSPAEALHGSYHMSRTFTSGIPKLKLDTTVRTDCLHTGDRCISYFHGPSGNEPLVFDGGQKWLLNVEDDGKCPASEDITHMKSTGQYPLPQPPQNPINLLTGHGHQDQSGACAMNTDFDETITRTGD